MAVIDTHAIADLLMKSRSAHLQYQQLARLGQRTASRDFLMQAATARLQADADDPDHLAPAWASEPAQYAHDDLLAFYRRQMAR